MRELFFLYYFHGIRLMFRLLYIRGGNFWSRPLKRLSVVIPPVPRFDIAKHDRAFFSLFPLFAYFLKA